MEQLTDSQLESVNQVELMEGADSLPDSEAGLMEEAAVDMWSPLVVASLIPDLFLPPLLPFPLP